MPSKSKLQLKTNPKHTTNWFLNLAVCIFCLYQFEFGKYTNRNTRAPQSVIAPPVVPVTQAPLIPTNNPIVPPVVPVVPVVPATIAPVVPPVVPTVVPVVVPAVVPAVIPAATQQPALTPIISSQSQPQKQSSILPKSSAIPVSDGDGQDAPDSTKIAIIASVSGFILILIVVMIVVSRRLSRKKRLAETQKTAEFRRTQMAGHARTPRPSRVSTSRR